jgi:hypothetical protein
MIQRQPQTVPWPVGFGRKEWLKDFFNIIVEYLPVVHH